MADLDIPKVLLESGKFARVCELVESLVGGKKPSERKSLDKKISEFQVQIGLTSKVVCPLLDRYGE